MPSQTEDQLYARFRATGCPDAIANLFDRAAPELYRVAVHLVRDRHLAEDLVQTTFLKSIDDCQAWDQSQPVLPWLLGILANRARYLIRQRRRMLDPEGLVKREPRDPSDLAAEREWAEELSRSIRELPEPYRHVLALHLEQGLSPKAIADAHGHSASTVRTQLSRGLDLLRKALPAGFAASAVVGTVPASTLSAMRSKVLTHAAKVAPKAAIGGVAVTIGTLIMKKTTLVCALLLAVLGLAIWPVMSEPTTAPATVLPSPDLVKAELEQASAQVATNPVRNALSPEIPSDSKFGSVGVRVLWSDRSPAVGVGVLLYPWNGENSRAYLETKHTDAEGRIHWEHVTAGHVDLSPDRTSKTVRLTLDDGEYEEREIVIPRKIHVHGRVIDSEGNPVGGSNLWLSPLPRRLGSKVATTDGFGRFSIRDVEDFYNLQARSPMHGPSYPQRLLGEPGSSLKVELILEGPSASLNGTVVDTNKEPIEGAVLRVDPNLPQRQDDKGFLIERPAPFHLHTDSDGRFEARGLNAGYVKISVRARGMGVWKSTVKLEARETRDLTIELPLGGIVHGQVTGMDGLPIAEAPVGFMSQHEDFEFAETNTDSNGRFELRGVTPGTHTIWAGDDRRGRATTKLEIQTGKTIEHDFVLTDGGDAKRIVGRVIDEEGQALSGLRVSIRDARMSTGWSGRAKTGKDGHFAVSHCPDENLTIRIYGSIPQSIPILLHGPVLAGGAEVVIRVPKDLMGRAHLTATILDSSNTPLVGATLAYKPADRRQGSVGAATSDELGQISVDIPPLEYIISTYAKDYPRQEHGRYKVEPDQILELGLISLKRPGTVSCTLVDEDGAAIARSFVTFHSEHGTIGGLLEGNGSTKSLAAAPGRYRLRFVAGGYATQSLKVVVKSGDTTDIRHILPHGIQRSIELVTAKGSEPIMGFEMVVRDGQGQVVDRNWRHGEVKSFLMNLSLGVHHVDITTEDGRQGSVTIVVDDLERVVHERVRIEL